MWIHRILVTILMTLALSADTAAAADAFVVVVHRDNPVSQITRKDLSDFLLRKKGTWGQGGAVEPVDLPPASPARIAFTTAIHERSVSAVKSYWQKMIFSGKKLPPPTRPEDAAVIAFVRERPRAIGYVSPDSVTDEVKVLLIAPPES